MTSIIYDGECIITDSGIMDGRDCYLGSTQKIFKIGRSRVLSGAGNLEHVHMIKEWLEGKREKPELDNSNVSILIVYDDGTHKVMFKDLIEIDSPLPVCMGSGCELLMGAYEVCKDPLKAMNAACKIDVYSSLPAQIHPF